MKPTCKQKLDDCYTTYTAAKTGQRPKRRAKDGSIPTHPVVPVIEQPEADVQDECVKWLKQRRIFHDTHDCGSGHGNAIYGIKFAGDIIGILPDGRHFEIECKHGNGGKLSKGQQDRRDEVQSTAGQYWVVHGLDELKLYYKGATSLGDLV